MKANIRNVLVGAVILLVVFGMSALWSISVRWRSCFSW